MISTDWFLMNGIKKKIVHRLHKEIKEKDCPQITLKRLKKKIVHRLHKEIKEKDYPQIT